MTSRSHSLTLVAAALLCPALLVAQTPAPQFPLPTESVSNTAPAPAFAPAPGFVTPVEQSPRKGRMRQFFAQTLSLVVQGSGASATVGVGDLVAGSINDWFERRARRKQAKAAAAAAGAGLPVAAPAPVFGPTNSAEVAPAAQFAVPQAADTAAPQFAPVQFFDTLTGAPTAPPPVFQFDASAPSVPQPGGEVFAGMAFEVHAVINGAAVPVNPANHEFHDGDQFIVMYRPSLPGRVRVTNINPLGVATDIDSREAAAGELLRLGPYRFEGTRGDESLRFVLEPCSNEALLVATRDIVRADSVPSSAGLQLGSCQPTRSIARPATRDIRKVAVEGNTGFAFDPVSGAELASGQFAPRELTVRFRHR